MIEDCSPATLRLTSGFIGIYQLLAYKAAPTLSTMMIISNPSTKRTCLEKEVYNTLLQLDGKQILELGCGKAEITRAIATDGTSRHVTALEVDEIQHRKHLAITDLANVDFIKAGAENIPCPNHHFDIVFMFKSLHHVPPELMDQALIEINRVLKPGGYVYISEPVFAGDFNDLLKMFHNEEEVRSAAFQSIKQSIDSGLFALQQQYFFNAPISFEDFNDFEQKTIHVTHTSHSLPDELYAQVKQHFEFHRATKGATFHMPIRIDLLRKNL